MENKKGVLSVTVGPNLRLLPGQLLHWTDIAVALPDCADADLRREKCGFAGGGTADTALDITIVPWALRLAGNELF